MSKIIEKSKQYLLETKVQKFEITLKEFLDIDKNDKDANAILSEELIKEFNLIQTSFENFKTREINLKSKIELVNNKLKESDNDIIILENKNKENETLINKFTNESKNYKNSQKHICELEEMINHKNNEIKELKDEKINIASYLTKLNEANSKIIHEKTEKIKLYENEIAVMQKKLLECQNKNKELNPKYILQAVQASDKYLELEKEAEAKGFADDQMVHDFNMYIAIAHDTLNMLGYPDKELEYMSNHIRIMSDLSMHKDGTFANETENTVPTFGSGDTSESYKQVRKTLTMSKFKKKIAETYTPDPETAKRDVNLSPDKEVYHGIDKTIADQGHEGKPPGFVSFKSFFKMYFEM